MLSPNRSNAAGLGSTTLADDMARNTLISPTICQKGNKCFDWVVSGDICGEGVTNIGADVAGLSVAVDMVVGVAVKDAVGEGGKVTVGVATKGITMMPASLSHRS